MDGKADLVWRLADDLDGDAGCGRGPVAGVASIGERLGDER